MIPAAPGLSLAADAGVSPRISPKSSSRGPAGFAGLCGRLDWACARGAEDAQLSEDQVALAQRVNRQVNARIRQVEDIDQYGREEVWALPTSRGGDCEDIALLKKAELIRAGISPNRLLLATVLDQGGNNHVVLVVRAKSGDYVLDSLNNRMLLWSRTPYAFLQMQNPRAPSQWTAVVAGGIFKS